MMSAARKLQSIGLLMLVTICALLAYPVSLHVSSTRTELRRVEAEITETRRRIRVAEGEIAVLANLSQLERWNTETFGYVAPASGQYLPGERGLASVRQLRTPVAAQDRAPIVLAMGTADADAVRSAETPASAGGAPRSPAPDDDRVAVGAMRDIAQLLPAPIVTQR